MINTLHAATTETQQQKQSNPKAPEMAQVLNDKTSRMFEMVLDKDFWAWVNAYFFTDYDAILKDLASFEGVNVAEKIIEILMKFHQLLKDNNIKNRIQLIIRTTELKQQFKYDDIFLLRTMIKILQKYLIME